MTDSDDRYAEFLEVLHRFDHAMLVTHYSGGMRSRPMSVVASSDDAKLWFMSNAESGKQDELAEDPGVNVSMQGHGRFLSISGTARVVRDRAAAERLWTESQRVWFPGGPHDPSLVLIEVVPHAAEYWDRSGAKGLKYRFAEADAIMKGYALDDDAGAHGKIRFED